MMTAKEKKVVREAVTCDSVKFCKDGTVEFKRSYFYRNGGSAGGFADAMSRRLKSVGCEVTNVESSDQWAAWPKTSYFVATMKVKVKRVETA